MQFSKKLSFSRAYPENFRKFSKNYLRTLLKCIILEYFSKIKKTCIHFSRFWTKTQIVGKFWAKFRKFSKKFVSNFWKMHILAYVSKDLTNPALIFRALEETQIVGKFWEKFDNFWRKFNRKIAFFIIFGKFVTKNKAFGNNTIFYNIFRLRGWIPPFPLNPPMVCDC